MDGLLLTLKGLKQMIKNDKQLKITKQWAKRFQKSIDELQNNKISEHCSISSIQIAALQGQLKDLNQQINEYISLKNGDIDLNQSHSFFNIGICLIRWRIARGLTQKGLAEKLGLHEQQIQRYEASDYEAASLARIRQVARVLDMPQQFVFIKQV